LRAYFGVQLVPKLVVKRVRIWHRLNNDCDRLDHIASAVAHVANPFAALIANKNYGQAHNVTVKLPGTVGNEKDKSLDPHGSIPLVDGIVEKPDEQEIVEGIDAQSKVADS